MDTHADREQESHTPPMQNRPGVPRWVAIFTLIALAVVVVLVVVMLLGGEHGPGMHSAISGDPQHAIALYAENIPS
ncbi:hypothetical protein [uncultured Arthrobacter sp.]|uniref:hypothetical protein n=1 Tax=uncultured Arthrobacter sp. TaxID=114050 RepID=UPI002636A911|nr:hypothetical protein [uncultured Arthrobacter sp.]